MARVAGANAAGTYYFFDDEIDTQELLGSQYKVDHIAEVRPMTYKARDGLEIPALLTIPPGVIEPKQLPLIVLPHGGPEAHGEIDFDWLAQFLAQSGYLVLQPNFRGSTGFGRAHRLAGHGHWGKAMQDDVSDGVKAMQAMGYADLNSVCIVGSSYGGYSALAGGAFSPELYRCVIEINGVSDIPLMLRDTRYTYGNRHWVVSYWNRIIADSDLERKKLKAISPAHFAKNFSAPVLLIHSKDDTVVPLEQSKRMHRKLKRADKSSEFLVLKGEDHWLSSSETRIQMLEAIQVFLAKHNPG